MSVSMAQLVSDKRAARARVYDLVAADNQRKTMKNAYRLKAEFLKEQRESAASDPRPDHCLIRTLDPLIVPPEGKFGHCQGAHISPPPKHKGLHKTSGTTSTNSLGGSNSKALLNSFE